MPLLLRAVAALLVLLVAGPATAQSPPDSTLQSRPDDAAGARTAEDEEQRYDRLVAQFQRPYLQFTALVQVVSSARFGSGSSGVQQMRVAAARFGVKGQLDGGIGYRLRADLGRQPALLDAFISYGTRGVRGIVGLQRVPFSYEQLTSAASIDFVNRSRIVRAIGPPREVGIELRFNPNGGPLLLRLGTANATYDGGVGESLGEVNRNGWLTAGRAQVTLGSSTDRQLIVGANAGYETDGQADVANPTYEPGARRRDHNEPTVRLYLPDRVIAGADARFRYGRLLLAAEGLLQRVGDGRSRLFEGAYDRGDVYGGFTTVGLDLTQKERALVRLDYVDEEGTNLVVGYNRQFTRAASFQANAVFPISDDAGHQASALFNFQLGF